MKPQCPCKGCNDRYYACHDVCEKYKKYKIELKKAKEDTAKAAGDATAAGKYSG